MREHGPWKVVGTREVYRDPWMRLTVDDVLAPDGVPGTFSVVEAKAGVSVLALEDGIVYLAREFRYAIGHESLEVVGGGMEEGEEPLAAARRELQEELGIEAARWTDMGLVHPLSAMVLSPARLFLAEELTFGEHRQEKTERIQCIPLPLEEAVRAVLEGRITQAPSCVLILRTWLLAQKCFPR